MCCLVKEILSGNGKTGAEIIDRVPIINPKSSCYCRVRQANPTVIMIVISKYQLVVIVHHATIYDA